MNNTRPQLPLALALPLRIIPDKLHSSLLTKILNYVFKQMMKDGELEFMYDRSLTLHISDANINHTIKVKPDKLEVNTDHDNSDVTISGTVYDFLLLISNKEDPDTLFFQRHLKMQGDTELGVHLKNMLAGIDHESLGLPAYLQKVLNRTPDYFERLHNIRNTIKRSLPKKVSDKLKL